MAAGILEQLISLASGIRTTVAMEDGVDNRMDGVKAINSLVGVMELISFKDGAQAINSLDGVVQLICIINKSSSPFTMTRKPKGTLALSSKATSLTKTMVEASSLLTT